MLSKWLCCEAPPNIKEYILLFPVVEHNFIPPDRVFENIEHKVCRVTDIESRKKYENIIKTFATVIHLGEECGVKDWKTIVSDVIKDPGSWHFQFEPCKTVSIKKSAKETTLVHGERGYKNDLGQY